MQCAKVAVRRVQLAGVSAAAPVTQRRNYEYWGMHTCPRAQPYTTGEELAETLNLRGYEVCDTDAQMLTGNGANLAYTTDLLTNREAENTLHKDQYKFFRGIDKWVYDPVTADECRIAADIFSKTDKGKLWWSRFFKLYPATRKPLDEEAQEEVAKWYGSIIAVAHDEEAVTELAKPFLRKYFEEKHITPWYWWRLSETLMDGMQQHHEATATFSGRQYGVRSLRVVIERATKISYNTVNDWTFATTDYVSPHQCELNGVRAVHEAGYW